MPTTYNGIGTHYYGKKNLEKRPGTCQQCGRAAELASYDTRLWFVVVFIPVIPLGRKRIVDYCSVCSRHYALDLHKWETAKQLEISGALDKFRSHPTPEAAIETHQALVNFHQAAQAAEFRQVMREKFADHARVQAYLGGVLTHVGRVEEAEQYFVRALALRSDLPEARVGVAEAHLRAQRFEEARRLLDFLEKPGAAQLYPLEPLETLGMALQRANRHNEALELFGVLLRELPPLADHTGFRKTVGKSEKALGRVVLPKRKFSWRRFLGSDRTAARPAGPPVTWRGLAVAGVIAVLVLLGFIVGNEYTRRHRTLHIVNELGRPVQIEVRGVGVVPLTRGHTELALPEGRHHATVTGAVREDVDFEVRSGYLDRWFGDPVWVLNVGGAAMLMVESAVYSREAPPPSYAFRFGQVFEYFPEVSHPFTPLPASLSLKSGEQRTLTHLEVYPGEASQLFQYFQKHAQWSDAWRLAESRLRWWPDDEALLRAYVAAAIGQGQIERVEKFLQAGLTNRPVQIEWHRAYQHLRNDRLRAAQLAADYDALLQAEPTNSALLYLRGRVAATRADAHQYFDRAREADPRNPFPYYALGYERMALGDWAAAKQWLARAVELRPKELAFSRYLGMARFALGEFGELEDTYRAQLQREPLNFFALMQLCDVLIAQGKSAEARQTEQAFARATASRPGEGVRDLINLLHRRLLYETGDFAGLEKHAAADGSPAARWALFQALLEQGRVAEALKVQPPADPERDEQPFHFLTIALAWSLAGQSTEARPWEEKALRALDSGDEDFSRAAALLRRADGPAPAELDAVILPINSKAILLAYLAQKHAAQRGELAAAARRLNVDPGFPHQLVQRATADPR